MCGGMRFADNHAGGEGTVLICEVVDDEVGQFSAAPETDAVRQH